MAAAFLGPPKAPYVLQGIHFLMRNRKLWKYCFCPLFLAVVFAVAVIAVSFTLILVPLALALSIPLTPFVGWPVAVLIVLIIIALSVLIFSTLILPPFTDKLFDQVLIMRGHQALVEGDHGGAWCGCLSLISVVKLIVTVITFPIHFIPVVGTVAWLMINGRYHAWDLHSHYFLELKRMNFQEQRKFVNAHMSFYHLFGTQALALEMIPVVFTFSNTVGSALYICDVEDVLREAAAQENHQANAAAADTIGNPKTDSSDKKVKTKDYGATAQTK